MKRYYQALILASLLSPSIILADATTTAATTTSASCSLMDPRAFTQNAVNQVLSVLQNDKSKISTDFATVKHDIQATLSPLIGIQVMSQFVVPPALWSAASAEQQSAFNQGFLEFIVNLYSSPLKDFKNQTVEVYPSRVSWQTQQRVQINSVIHNPDAGSTAADIPVSFILQKNGCSWQFIDFVVDNISALANIQSQVQSILQNIQNPSLPDLTSVIVKHNASTTT